MQYIISGPDFNGLASVDVVCVMMMLYGRIYAAKSMKVYAPAASTVRIATAATVVDGFRVHWHRGTPLVVR